MAIERPIPKNMRANYHGLIHTRRGTGTLKDLPFGCSVSFKGRNLIVAGYDEIDGKVTLRLVNRNMSRELSKVEPDEVTKTVGRLLSR